MSGKELRGSPFITDEAGSLTIFGCVMLLLILLLAGASVDFTRYESTRAHLQNTLDRAVLAAADMDQKAHAQSVVTDYMVKAGLATALTHVSVDQEAHYRKVTARGAKNMDTVFLRMAAMDQMSAPALSIAKETRANVEVSLVLDVSKSMDQNNRLTNMREAASEFVDTVVKPQTGGFGLTTVSLVPYNSSVNLGPATAPFWNINKSHDYSYCAMFDDADFTSVPVDDSLPLRQMGHFDIENHYLDENESQRIEQVVTPMCGGLDQGSVIVHSSNKNQLLQRIGQMSAYGDTAMHVGMKWGAALLDPATRPVVQNMANAGLVDANASNRPVAYSNPEAIKFIVMMSDGANTKEGDLKPQFRVKDSLSPVFVDDRGTEDVSDDRYSVLVTSDYMAMFSADFYERPDPNNWRFYRERFQNDRSNRYSNEPDGGNAARQMTNQELFARFNTPALAQRLLQRPAIDGQFPFTHFRNYSNPRMSVARDNTVETRLSNICGAAKAQGIVVFTVAFEAPDQGKDDLRSCASSPSHFFEADGEELSDAFHSIARQINTLKLLQ